MARRVVITGMGIWSCIGTSLDEVRDALYQGKSGIIFSQERKDAGFRSALVGNVPQVDIKAYVPRSLRNFMPEEAQYGYIATKQALENAGIDEDYIASHEVGIIYGNDSVAEATMNSLDKFRQAGSSVACGSGVTNFTSWYSTRITSPFLSPLMGFCSAPHWARRRAPGVRNGWGFVIIPRSSARCRRRLLRSSSRFSHSFSNWRRSFFTNSPFSLRV